MTAIGIAIIAFVAFVVGIMVGLELYREPRQIAFRTDAWKAAPDPDQPKPPQEN